MPDRYDGCADPNWFIYEGDTTCGSIPSAPRAKAHPGRRAATGDEVMHGVLSRVSGSEEQVPLSGVRLLAAPRASWAK